MPLNKFRKEKDNKVAKLRRMEVDKDEKPILEKILGDISKTSATKQLVLGTSSGWITGWIFMKVGKVVAVAVGGGIILLEVANEQGYIKVNWNKVNKKLDKVADKVEEKITGESSTWVDKITTFAKTHMSFTTGFVGGFFVAMEHFVDRKIDRAEEVLRQQQRKAKKWYADASGQPYYKMKESYIFVASFFAGVCIGIATS